MLSFRNCRILCKGKKDILKFATSAFSSKGKDPKTSHEPLTVPTSDETPWNEHANWELLGMRGYRFCLPGNVGLSPQRKQRSNTFKKVPRPKKAQQYVTLPDSSYIRHMEIVTQLAVLAGELSFVPSEPQAFRCQAVDCPYLLRDQVLDLFPRANVGHGHLTAVCVALRCLPKNMEKDLKRLLHMFEETARRVCSKLSVAGFWADFPSSETVSGVSPGPATAAQVEAARQLSSPGMRVQHVAGCILLMHAPPGESRILGWLFTTASFDDPKLVEILQEENM